MEITNEIIDKLAKLAKLQFKDEQRDGIREDLTKIIAFVDKIDELDTQLTTLDIRVSQRLALANMEYFYSPENGAHTEDPSTLHVRTETSQAQGISHTQTKRDNAHE